MNARDGWEFLNDIGGYSHRFHRCFWDAAFRGNATRLGEINEYSRSMCRSLLITYSANYWRWVYYELNLFGDPATPFAAAINTSRPDDRPRAAHQHLRHPDRLPRRLQPLAHRHFDPDAVRSSGTRTGTGSRLHPGDDSGLQQSLEAAIAPQQPTPASHTRSRAEPRGIRNALSRRREQLRVLCTDRLSLTIDGSPTQYDTPDPTTAPIISLRGLSLRPRAAIVPTDGGERVTLSDFSARAVPQSGTNLTVSFQMTTSSTLVWMWQGEYRLIVYPDLDGQTTQTLWVAKNEIVDVPDAEQEITLSNGTSARSPNGSSTARAHLPSPPAAAPSTAR
jgi:hypothetical protein